LRGWEVETIVSLYEEPLMYVAYITEGLERTTPFVKHP
jgi:hypothetical protein